MRPGCTTRPQLEVFHKRRAASQSLSLVDLGANFNGTGVNVGQENRASEWASERVGGWSVVLTCSCEAFDQGVSQLARSDEPNTHAV